MGISILTQDSRPRRGRKACTANKQTPLEIAKSHKLAFLEALSQCSLVLSVGSRLQAIQSSQQCTSIYQQVREFPRTSSLQRTSKRFQTRERQTEFEGADRLVMCKILRVKGKERNLAISSAQALFAGCGHVGHSISNYFGPFIIMVPTLYPLECARSTPHLSLPREILFSAGRPEAQPLSEVTGNRLLEYGLCGNSHQLLLFNLLYLSGQMRA